MLYTSYVHSSYWLKLVSAMVCLSLVTFANGYCNFTTKTVYGLTVCQIQVLDNSCDCGAVVVVLDCYINILGLTSTLCKYISFKIVTSLYQVMANQWVVITAEYILSTLLSHLEPALNCKSHRPMRESMCTHHITGICPLICTDRYRLIFELLIKNR